MTGDPLRRPYQGMVEARRRQAEMTQRREIERQRAAKLAEHENPALVAGSIYGLRAFNTSPDFRDGPKALYPLVMNSSRRWTPGWNTATCPNGCSAFRRRHDMLTMHGFFVHPTRSYESQRPASVAMDCSCGFHAFTDADQIAAQVPVLPGRSQIVGVVEGAGKTVIASMGFRSERSRVVALVQPPSADPVSLTRRVFEWFWILVAALGVLWGVAAVAFFGGSVWWKAVSIAVSAVALMCWVWMRRSRQKPERRIQRLATEYGVLLFPSQDEAVAAFPLGMVEPGRKAG